MSARLTPGALALLSIRAHKRQYRALTAGIALAIFFVSAMLALGQSVYFTYQERHYLQVGEQDVTMLDSESVSPEALIKSGYAREVGSAYIIGVEADSGLALAYYDPSGEALAHRKVLEGRMPQSVDEIAVESAKLSRISPDAKLGDTLTIKIKVPAGDGRFLPDAVEKSYKLVGVLQNQSVYQQNSGWSGQKGDENYLTYPGAVVSIKEHVEVGGRPVVNRMVARAAGVSTKALVDYAWDKLDFGGMDVWSFSVFSGQEEGPMLMFAVIVLGTVLVLASIMAIVGAFSATLSERRTQIGMMRAVGATRGQIRRLFGREAMLIALITAPVAVAAAHLAAWALSLVLGDSFVYRVSPWAIPAELVLSAACVAGAAAIPLFEASHVSPMQAIRETSLLRARRRLHIKPRAMFWPPSLLARRHLRLYRAKQVGVAAAVALSITVLSLGAWMLWMSGTVNRFYDYDFEIDSFMGGDDWFVETDALKPRLTDSDIREAEQLPLVSDVQASKIVQVNLLLDHVSEYITGRDSGWDYDYLKDDNPLAWEQKRYLELQRWLNTDKQLVHTSLGACSEEVIERLKPYVLSGKIDQQALNAGREVLAVAPDTIYIYEKRDAQGNITEFDMAYNQDEDGRHYDIVLHNDMFFWGDNLNLCRLHAKGDRAVVEGEYDYRDIARADRTVTIGAVLSQDALSALPTSMNLVGSEAAPLLTTLSGFSTLGFETSGYRDMAVALGSEPDTRTEEYLESRLSEIANRTDGMSFSSSFKIARENAKWRVMLISSFIAVLTLLFVLCMGMVNNAVTNRIRSDRRAIGTLRAVGASLSAIVESYWRQVGMMLLYGAAAGAAISAGALGWIEWQAQSVPPAIILPLIGLNAAFLLLIALSCGVNLHARIRVVVKASIVENIREL